MPGIVERGTDQIVHRRVDDGEALRLTGLQIEDARQQNTGVADQSAPGLQQQHFAATAEQANEHRGVVRERHRRLVAVANAEAAADVDVRERDAARR